MDPSFSGMNEMLAAIWATISSSTAAAWVQGVGTILAVWVAARAASKQVEAQRALVNEERSRQVKVVAGIAKGALYRVEHTFAVMRTMHAEAYRYAKGGYYQRFIRGGAAPLQSVPLHALPDDRLSAAITDFLLEIEGTIELIDQLAGAAPGSDEEFNDFRMTFQERTRLLNRACEVLVLYPEIPPQPDIGHPHSDARAAAYGLK